MKLLVLTDPHVAPAGTPDAYWHNALRFETAENRLKHAVEIARSHNADAIAVLGDLSNFGDEASCTVAVGIVASSDLDVWIVPGNHDSQPDPTMVARTVEKLGNRRVRVASSIGEAYQHCRIAGASLTTSECDQQSFSMADLTADAWGDDLVLWLSHYPVRSTRQRLVQARLAYAGDAIGHAHVADLLANRFAPTLVLSGHLHVRDAISFEGVFQLSVAALVEPPFEVAIVDVESGHDTIRLRIRCLAVEDSGDVRLPLLVPADIAWSYEIRELPGGERRPMWREDSVNPVRLT